MNIFKTLDAVFPVLPNRSSGEVVGVGIRVFLGNVDLGEISAKRKAWYVNTSVNAFHMHRQLIREFMEIIRGSDLSDKQIRRAKRLIGLAVLNAYIRNRETDVQGYEHNLHIQSPPQGSVSMWWEVRINQWAEIVDKGLGLQTLADIAVIELSGRLTSVGEMREPF
jgi:hypothetical protein